MLPGIESFNKLAFKLAEAIELAQVTAISEERDYAQFEPNWSEEITTYEKANNSWIATKFRAKLLEYI